MIEVLEIVTRRIRQEIVEDEVLMNTKTKGNRQPKDPYLDLILNVYPLRPIRSAEEHQKAKTALRSMAGDKREVAAEFKKVLISIIETYERDAGLQIDTSGVSAAEIVRHLLAERQMSVNAFARAQGISQSALSDMLNGKRDWSKSVIVKVADFFSLNRGLFLR
jgi:antitoxin component HigA of HigAB toxin-antitoxin module